MQPLVSLIMPAYNAEKYVGKAIESILTQTMGDFEFIIIDDCSTDRTPLIITEYQDPRIRLIVNKCNKGISFSTNRGLACAQGKYIALMDDDDMSTPERFDKQVSYLQEHTEIDVLGGRSVDIDAEGNVLRKGPLPHWNPKYIKSALLFRCLDFRNGTTMMRKDFVIHNNLLYRENCFGMQDYRFFIDCSKVGNISSIEDVLLLYRIHENNETRHQMVSYSQARSEAYARFQIESLEASGYSLSENSLYVINRFILEGKCGCETPEDLEALYNAFSELLFQARTMGIDYYEELEIVCKQHLSAQFRSMIRF